MKLLRPLFMLISILCYSCKLEAQTDQSDSSFYQSAIYNALAFYQQSAGDQSRLLNGRRYKPYRVSFVSEHPFFLSDKFAPGSVIYEDGVYENVQLLYDEVKGMLIAQVGVSMELIMERVRQFSISGHFFTRLPSDSSVTRPGPGFYERLYSGKIEIYKQEKKLMSDDFNDTDGVRGLVTTKKNYYLRKDGQYYPVKNKNRLYDLLGDHKKEMQQFVKNKGLDFNRDKDNTIAAIAAYFDQLTR